MRLVLERTRRVAAGVPRGLRLLARRRRARASTASGRGTRRRRRPRGRPARRRARPGSSVANGASRSSRIRRAAGAGRDPPETGGIIATSSPSASDRRRVGVVAVPREADRRPAGRQDRVARRRARPRRPRRPRRRRRSRATSRVPASSRWIANSRTRTRIATSPPAPVSRATTAMSRPSPTGRIVAVKRGSARTAASNARRAAVFASSGARPAGRPTRGRSTGRCRRRRARPGASRPTSASR